MDIVLIENKYAELKRAFDNAEMDVEAFQAAVDELQTQDDYGRYWVIGAETGTWYYYDGTEWVQADPRHADTLPFVDENGVYWMLGKETNQWYYFDGEQWQLPAAEESQTQYYQDDDGRYWAQGAKSGQWYFYDEKGWHLADELQPPASFAPVSPPPAPADYTATPFQAPAFQSGPFQPVQPAPSYLQTPPPYGQQPPVQPQPQPTPTQQPPAQQPDYTQPVAPPPQPQPSPQPHATGQTTTPPTEAPPEAGVWYYFDGEQWLKYYDSPEPEAQEEETFPAEEEALEAGVWYYFDGETWLRYQDVPEDLQAEIDEQAEYLEEEEPLEELDEEFLEDEDDFLAADKVIDIEDLDEFVEVVEISEDDIIVEEDDFVEAEFQVDVFTPEQEKAAAASVPTTPVQPVEASKTPIATASTADAVDAPQKQAATVPPVAPEKVARAAQTIVEPVAGTRAAPQVVSIRSGLKTLPVWLWTALGGAAILFLAAFIIIGAIYLLGNREKAVALLETQQTPTLPAAAPQTTPTLAPTPTATATTEPTPTQVPLTNYTSNYFGFSLEYPSGWVFKEDDDLVIFAPSARALDRTSINGASLRISLAANKELTELLTDQLQNFAPISNTLNEGIMNIGRQTWTSAQIQFNSKAMGTDAIALVASTVVNSAGYTLVAVAPAAEWEDYKPLFQSTIDSFAFIKQSIAAGTPPPTGKAPTTPKTTPTKAITTATTAPSVAEPTLYEVQAGDTLGGIAVKFDVSIGDLVKANNLSDENAIIRIGQKLIIPQPGIAVAAITATPTPKATSTPRPTSTPKGTATAATTTTATPTKKATSAATPTTAPTATPAPTVAPSPTPTAEAAVLSGRIAYPAYSTDINSFNIWSTNIDGSNPVIIAGNASEPKFSRDGSLLAYRSWTPDKRGIYFVDYAGGRQGLLTSFVEDALPTWYTDGTLVFTSRREGDRVPRLFRVGQDGGDGYSLGFNSDYVDTMPNDQLVARGCTPSGDCGLWLMTPDASGSTKISNFTSDTAPAASPNGDRIAIMSTERGDAGNWEIWTISPDGSDPVRLTENPANDGLPTWSPDGKSIAFVSDRNGAWAIWVMNADGTEQRKLFDMQGSPDGQVLHDTENSHGWLEERITWAP